jgi:hypothetical protein
MIDLLGIIGIVGTLLILIGFIVDEFFDNWNQDTVRYNLLNLIGAALLLYYAYSLRVWPFVLLNAVWLVVAAVKLARIYNTPH